MMVLSMCTKEDPVRKYKIENETREWTAYKEGSYWIYQNEDSGEIDTLKVDKYAQSEELVLNNEGDKILEQKISITFRCKHGYYISEVSNIQPRGNNLKIRVLDREQNPISNIETMLIFPLSFNDQSSNTQFSILSKEEKVTVGNKTLSNVLHIKCIVKGMQGILANTSHENEYWIACKHWIVKMKTKNNETGSYDTWVLKRHNIVQ